MNKMIPEIWCHMLMPFFWTTITTTSWAGKKKITSALPISVKKENISILLSLQLLPWVDVYSTSINSIESWNKMFLIYLVAVAGVSPNDLLSAKKDRPKQSYLIVIIAWLLCF